MKATIKNLKSLNVSTEAIKWAETQPDPQTAWDNCERGDWMLWLLGKLSDDPYSESRKKLVLTACQCARPSLKYIPEGEERPLKAIETAEAWANGKNGVSLEDVKIAAADAAAASIAYASYVADAAAASIAYATDAVNFVAALSVGNITAAGSGGTAAAAAAAAALADGAAVGSAGVAGAEARNKTFRQCADIVREYYPEVPKLILKNKLK